MRKVNVILIHFQSIEGYPPVMNDINDLMDSNMTNLTICSTKGNNNWFNSAGANMFRFGNLEDKSIFSKVKCYFLFNLFIFFLLLLKRSDIIFVYETLSIIPVYFAKLLNKNLKIHIHYHEYATQKEYNKSSLIGRFAHNLEVKLYNKENVYVSHTNQDRINLFVNENELNLSIPVLCFPNYPPATWYDFAKDNKVNTSDINPVKLIHIGALDIKTMYVKEIIEWVEDNCDKCNISFYISISNQETMDYLNSRNSNCISVFPSIKYYELPNTIINYDVGLTLYKGCIANHVFSVPNKVMEYLACGIQVWYSKELLSTTKFVGDNNIRGCYSMDFSKMDNFSISMKHGFNNNEFFNSTNKLENKITFHLKNI